MDSITNNFQRMFQFAEIHIIKRFRDGQDSQFSVYVLTRFHRTYPGNLFNLRWLSVRGPPPELAVRINVYTYIGVVYFICLKNLLQVGAFNSYQIFIHILDNRHNHRIIYYR